MREVIMMMKCKRIIAIMLMGMMLLGWHIVSLPTAVYAEENTTQNTVTNNSKETIHLTIEHYLNGEQFYKSNYVELKPGYSISGYNKVTNYAIKIVTLDEQPVDDIKNVIIHESGNHTMRISYLPTHDENVLHDVHFYDYSMIPNDGTPGINDLINYDDGARYDNIVGKRDKNEVYGNAFTVGLTTSQGDPLKAPTRFSGFHDENGKPVFMKQGNSTATKGIVKSLSGENYSQVNFRDGIYAPKLFNNDPNVHVYGMTNIDDYKLRFERHGDTYTLKEALKPDGSHAGNIDLKTKQATDAYNGGSNFFPLDDYSADIPDEKINISNTYSKRLADGSREYHNMLFGMRFDVKFNVGDYTDSYLKNMKFNFSGDDDMWAFIDGKLALDVGGIHGELPGSFNVGDYIGEGEKGKEHTLTVLYLERGGNLSNCAISFMLPGTSNGSIKGTKINFDKYLVMNQNANVPNATFTFNVAIPTEEEMKKVKEPTDTELPLKQGVGSETVTPTKFAPGDETFDIPSTSKKYAKKEGIVDLSNVTFTEPGVYRYKITENPSTDTGITIDSTPKYLDIYIAFDENGYLVVQKYVFHDLDNNINNRFTNTYATLDLTLKKTVTGSLGAWNQYFKFTINITNLKPNTRLFVTDQTGNKIYHSNDVIHDDTQTTPQQRFVARKGTFTDINTGTSEDMKGLVLNTNNQGSATFDIYLKHGETIKLNGLTAKAKYTITEQSQYYKVTAKKDNDSLVLTHNDDQVTTTQILNDNDEVEFINNREGVVPTGIEDHNNLKLDIVGVALSSAIIIFKIRKLRKHH